MTTRFRAACSLLVATTAMLVASCAQDLTGSLSETYGTPVNSEATEGGDQLSAAEGGVLVFTDGCATFTAGERVSGVILPAGTVAGVLDGNEVVLDSDGAVWMRAGEMVEVGGAPIDPSSPLQELWNEACAQVPVSDVVGVQPRTD